jgi:hypothetical protein
VRTQVLYKVVLSGARRVKAVMDNREIERWIDCMRVRKLESLGDRCR